MDPNKSIPMPLRIFLWLLNHFVWVTGRPLQAMRPRMQLFMKLTDWLATERTSQAFIVKDTSFLSTDGFPIPVRLYIPSISTTLLPVLIYYHGGGFALGNHKIRNQFNRTLAARTGTVLVSVGYRLAPEHPFPQGVEDAYKALCWCAAHAVSFGGDAERIALVGESAGGNIAAVTALMARDRGGPKVKCQALLYPAVDLSGSQPSVAENGHGYMLTVSVLRQFIEGYMPQKEQRQHPYASPLLAEKLTGLPPAMIITAGLCPLRDQGHQYAERLAQAGVPVVYKCYEGMIHDFTVMMSRVLTSARDSLHHVTLFLRENLKTE